MSEWDEVEDDTVYPLVTNPRYEGDDMLNPTYNIFGEWE